MFLITGATGQLGQFAIKHLLKKVPASQIVALARNPEKAKDLSDLGIVVRKGDYTDKASLTAAFEGVKKVLLISSSEIGKRFEQHKNVIDAAKEANVELIAYTSLLRADTSPLGLAAEHIATEKYLKDSGVPHALLRHGWYTENYAASIPSAIANGALYGAAGAGKISSAARNDYAEADIEVLTSDNQAGKIYELGGDEAYTLADFAAELSKQTGKEIPYINLPEADYKGALLQAGLPEPVAELLANSDAGAKKGGLYDETKTLSKIIKRATTPLSEVIAASL